MPAFSLSSIARALQSAIQKAQQIGQQIKKIATPERVATAIGGGVGAAIFQSYTRII